MIAKAPGKVILSGAYSVLMGAKAIVSAVSKYAIADSDRAAHFVTAEVQQAVTSGAMQTAVWFDASELRCSHADGSDHKLGLGSSAAILVASLAVSRPDLDREALLPIAMTIHNAAQGGGSGIDVAASTLGNTLLFWIENGEPRTVMHKLPDVHVSVFASHQAASTQAFLAAVRAFAQQHPSEHRDIFADAITIADAAADSTDVRELVSLLMDQAAVLHALGKAAGIPIFTVEDEALQRLAADEDAAFYPSGAGGGDILLFVAQSAPSAQFLHEASVLGRTRLDVDLGVPGVTVTSSQHGNT